MTGHLCKKLPLLVLVMISLVTLSSCGLRKAITGKDAKKVEKCKDNFNKVKELSQLKVFLTQLNEDLLAKRLTKKEVGSCLKSKIIDELTTFLELINEAGEGRICLDKNLNRIVEIHPDMVSPRKDNKEKRLAPLWDKFVRQVLITCKSNLTEKLDQVERDDEKLITYMKVALNFAQNFDWLDDNHLIKQDDLKLVENMSEKSLDSFGDLVQTSGNLEELLRAEKDKYWEMEHFNKENIRSRHAVDLTLVEYKRMLELFGGCDYLLAYQKTLIDPLLQIQLLGYDDTENNQPDKQIDSYRHINIWLAASQICHMVKNVNVMHLHPFTRIEFRETSRTYQTDIDMQYSPLDYKSDAAKKISWSIVRDSDKFSEFDSDLDKVRCMSIEEKNARSKSLYNSKKLFEQTGKSKRFFQMLANFIKSIKDFEQTLNNRPTN